MCVQTEARSGPCLAIASVPCRPWLNVTAPYGAAFVVGGTAWISNSVPFPVRGGLRAKAVQVVSRRKVDVLLALPGGYRVSRPELPGHSRGGQRPLWRWFSVGLRSLTSTQIQDFRFPSFAPFDMFESRWGRKYLLWDVQTCTGPHS